jgi:hypothetical protein
MAEKKFLNLSQNVSQDDIYTFFNGVETQKILERKVYQVWAFSNENLEIMSRLTNFKEKEIFAILGSADQAVFFLAKGAKLVIGCDVRDAACFFAEFKKATLEHLTPEEFKEMFFNSEKKNSDLYFDKIQPSLSKGAKKVFDHIFEGLPRNILQTLRRSNFFYRESWYFLKKNKWVPYFESELIKQAKKRIRNFFILNISLEEGIKNFRQRFNLVYTSNIFDSKKYCPDPEQTILRIDENLVEGGEILITTQEDPKRIIPFLKKLGYNLKIIEPKNKFLTLFSKTYAYYYILAKKPRSGVNRMVVRMER